MGRGLLARDGYRSPEAVIALDKIALNERWESQYALLRQKWDQIWVEINPLQIRQVKIRQVAKIELAQLADVVALISSYTSITSNRCCR